MIELVNPWFYAAMPVTCAVGWCAGQVVQWLLPLGKGRFRRFALYGVCWLTTNMVIHLGDPVNILGIFPVFLAGIWLCCSGSRMTRLSMGIILFPLCTSLNALLDTNRNPYQIAAVVRLLFWCALLLVIRRTVPRGSCVLPDYLWLLVDVLALLPLLTVLLTVALSDMERGIEPTAAVLLPYSAVVSLGLLAAVVLLSRQERLAEEQRLWQMRSFYFQNLEREQKQVRRLRHDMANHLQVLAGLEGEAVKSYLQELLQSPAMRSSRRYCENEVVNTVLASKCSQMEELKIDAEIRTQVPERLPLSDIELCAVFANGLDNAIEACQKLPVDQRRIQINARVSKGIFVLLLSNPTAERVVIRDGTVPTSKRDAALHGFGLASIREIARRYGGELELQAQEGCFTLLLSVPVAEQAAADRNGN